MISCSRSYTKQTQCTQLVGPEVPPLVCSLVFFSTAQSTTLLSSIIFPCIGSSCDDPEHCITHLGKLGIYCIAPQNLQDISVLGPQLYVEVTTCPFCGPVWITASAFERSVCHSMHQSPSALHPAPTYWGQECFLLHFPQIYIKKQIVAHLDMAIWSYE